MPTTFLAEQTVLRRIARAGLLAGCALMSAGAGNAVSQAGPCSAVNAVSGAAKVSVTDARAPVLNLAHKAGKARLEITSPGAGAQGLPLKTDANVDPRRAGATVALVASVSDKILLVQDTYASRPGPLSMCQAGEESFLRVIQLAPLKQLLSLKLASCRDNIELASPGLEWQAATATLGIHWLSGPNHTAEVKMVQIASNGEIILSPAMQQR